MGVFDDPRIRYFKNEVGFGAYNVSKNWDRCLEYADGDYFLCMGDDDKLLPDCLQQYITLIEKYPGRKVYHAKTQIIDSDSHVYNLQESRPETETAYSMIWHKWNVGRKSWIGDYLFETESLRGKGGFIWFPYAWGSEEATVYYQASFGGIANMQNFGFQYRCHNKTISADTGNLKGKADSFVYYRKWFKDFLHDSHPLDKDDELYLELINKRFKSLFEESILMVIRDDARYNHFKNVKYWMSRRDDYLLTKSQIWKSILIGIRQSVL